MASPTCGIVLGPARVAGIPMAWISFTNCSAIVAPYLRPVSNSSGVGGVLGASTDPAIEELAGISEGAATKSYTQILFGRARPGWVIGVWSVTLVEAHPATTNSSRHTTIRSKCFIINSLLRSVERDFSR